LLRLPAGGRQCGPIEPSQNGNNRFAVFNRSTIHRWAKDGIMPAPLSVGGSKRWDVQSIREWIDGGCEPLQLE
jgi:hypothetical protein